MNIAYSLKTLRAQISEISPPTNIDDTPSNDTSDDTHTYTTTEKIVFLAVTGVMCVFVLCSAMFCAVQAKRVRDERKTYQDIT